MSGYNRAKIIETLDFLFSVSFEELERQELKAFNSVDIDSPQDERFKAVFNAKQFAVAADFKRLLGAAMTAKSIVESEDE